MTNTRESVPPEAGFSLVRGDLLFRLQRKVGLIPAQGAGLVRRALFWSMLGWLPIAVWAAVTGRALPGATAAEPLLVHFGIHARLLFAVPLLILAEGSASRAVAQVVHAFVASGLVGAAQRPAFDAALARADWRRDTTLPWIVLCAVVLSVVSASVVLRASHEVDWTASGPASSGLGFGGLWYLYVGRTIYLTLVLGWLWRMALQTMMLWRIARLELSLVPTHPDRTGGLGFLERLPAAAAPLVLAVSFVLASRWAHDALHHGFVMTTLRVEIAAFVLVCVALPCLPLLAFAGPLARARKQALYDYGALVGRHGRLVHQRWIEGRAIGEEAVLEAPELGPVADTAALYDSVKAMRAVPIGKASLIPLALAAALPLLAAVALQLPVKEIALKLLKAVV